MIDKGVTVTELSKKIGIATSNLSRKFQNNSEDYKISYLQNIAKNLGCRIEVNIIDSESDKILYTLTDIGEN